MHFYATTTASSRSRSRSSGGSGGSSSSSSGGGGRQAGGRNERGCGGGCAVPLMPLKNSVAARQDVTEASFSANLAGMVDATLVQTIVIAVVYSALLVVIIAFR